MKRAAEVFTQNIQKTNQVDLFMREDAPNAETKLRFCAAKLYIIGCLTACGRLNVVDLIFSFRGEMKKIPRPPPLCAALPVYSSKCKNKNIPSDSWKK